MPGWAVVGQTHLVSGWPKVRIFSKNRRMKDVAVSEPQVGLVRRKSVGRELERILFLYLFILSFEDCEG